MVRVFENKKNYWGHNFKMGLVIYEFEFNRYIILTQSENWKRTLIFSKSKKWKLIKFHYFGIVKSFMTITFPINIYPLQLNVKFWNALDTQHLSLQFCKRMKVNKWTFKLFYNKKRFNSYFNRKTWLMI